MRCMSVFHSAAQALIRHQNELQDKSADDEFAQVQFERTLPKDEWIQAVISGVDEHSPRWRHLIALGGLLLGFGPPEDENLSRSMRSTIESALMKATNLSLQQVSDHHDLSDQTITLVLNHCFPNIADYERSQLDYDALLSILMRSTFHSVEGLQWGYFLGSIDIDIKQASNSQFQWPERSASFQRIQNMLSSPLLASLGPLARLIGHAISECRQPQLTISALEDLEKFSRTLHMQWRQNKLSEIDASEESQYLDAESLEKTTPQLWKLLKSTLFAVVIVLRSIVGRALGDGSLANDQGKIWQ